VPAELTSVPAATSPEAQRHLDETVRVWLGLPTGVETPRLPEHLSTLLLRLEEHANDRRDRWGCWDYEFSENHRAGRLRIAELDRWLAERRAELGRTAALEPLWPDDRSFAVCVTHDVDLVSNRETVGQALRHARAGASRLGAEDGGGLQRLARPPVRLGRSLRRLARTPSTRDTLERSVELELERGIRASYLFTVQPLAVRSRWDCVYAPNDRCLFRGRTQRIADVMNLLAGEGLDVGLHGSYAAAREPGALAVERELLREATGLDITSTRQHFLHWDVRWTPQQQDAAGLRIDSSLGFNREVGYRAGTSLPFRQFDVRSSRPLDLLELPLVVQDGALLGEIGIGADLASAKQAVTDVFDEAQASGGAVTFLFHPDKLALSTWAELYEWTLDQTVERGAWSASLSDVDSWFRAREARVLGRDA
jgi:hypothetical protein